MEGDQRPPVSDGSGRDREVARQALAELSQRRFRAEGWRARRCCSGRPLAFEIVVKNREEERLALAYAHSLARIGVFARVRLVDEAQYQRRRENFDFDMIIGSWIATPSPGAEQRGRWGSSSADVEGAYNLAGVRSSAIDAVIDALLAARSARGFCRGGAGARSVVDLGVLHRSVILCASAVDRVFGEARTAGAHAAVRRRSLDLVAAGVLTMTLVV